jgi:hypothetical protein
VPLAVIELIRTPVRDPTTTAAPVSLAIVFMNFLLVVVLVGQTVGYRTHAAVHSQPGHADQLCEVAQ